ncbi:hypothetical protein M7I_4331 [Glarea lozoyensis 74030]|uniref:Uncharacterized protein n=1 Tax=Glarea lozoyensis (strain ATCC 74030 / MF5533) TaxID=1104152 RepID=H0ENW8_GLAL7|nr:hypothetical protein M7I_4331 [Glarea lozoyensis 74030]
MGSYVMVHKRAGSNVSNRTSPVGSDRQGAYSVPSHGSAAEWTHAEHTVEMDLDDEHYGMPHDTKAILFNNMSGPACCTLLFGTVHVGKPLLGLHRRQDQFLNKTPTRIDRVPRSK